MIALAMQRWGLHRRVALGVIARVGTRPQAVLAGFMAAAAFLSMWVSNTATAVMMLPIALSVVEMARAGEEVTRDHQHFATALVLGIAYACNIGGLGTLIGTPPNALLAGFMSEAYGVQIGFAQWMLVGLPLVALGLPLAFFVLTRISFPFRLDELPGGDQLIRQELRRLGALSGPERRVGLVFLLTATLWIARPLLEGVVPGLSDASIAMLGATLLFVVPATWREGTFLLNWETASRLPWDVLVLFGGGLTLAAAIERTGLAAWIGAALGGVAAWPPSHSLRRSSSCSPR